MNTETSSQAEAETAESTLPPLSLSMEDINQDLYGKPPVAPEQTPAPETKLPAAKVSETPETSETPKEEPPKAEQPPETPKAEEPEPTTTEETPKEDEPKSIRVRIDVSPLEIEAIELRKRLKSQGEDVPSLKEAIEIVEVLREKTKPAPTQAAPAIEERNALESDRSAAETELSEVTAKLDELAEAESPINRDFLALQDRKNALNNRLRDIEGRHVDRIKAVRGVSRSEAIAMYPSAADETSALGRMINADIAEMKANVNHPDRALLTLENAPEAVANYSANKLAAKLAKEQGITKVAALQTLMAKTEAKAQPKETPAPPTTQTKKIAPVSGTASTKAEAPKPEPWNAADPKNFKPEAYADLYKGNKGLIFRL